MKQSEIWLIDLNPTVGAEIQKIRPAVVVSGDTLGKLPLKVIVPITDWKEHYGVVPWMVELTPARGNGLSKHSAADCFQVRSLSTQRFTKKLGKVTAAQLEEIQVALAKVLSIGG